MARTVSEGRIASPGMPALRVCAALLAASLMLGECWRSWGAGRPAVYVLDDQLMGGFLLASAWAVRSETGRNRNAFSAAWGVLAGMLYGSFFGKVFNPGSVNAGNWDLGILTWLVGVAFVLSVLGLWFSVTLPSRQLPGGGVPDA